MKENSSFKNNIFVMRQLASRELKHGNASKNLGQIWNIINPFVSMLCLAFIFSAVFHRTDAKEFMCYVFTGTIIFSFFDQGMAGCMHSLTGNKSLLIRTKIPKNLLLIEKLYVAFIRLLFSLVGYIIILIATQTPVGPTVVLAPIGVILGSVIILGLGKILAVINVYFADINYFYTVIMRLVFYGSGLFYDVSVMSPAMQRIISYNPIYLTIAFERSCILYNQIPALSIWIKLIIFAVALYSIGTLVFVKGSQDVVAKI